MTRGNRQGNQAFVYPNSDYNHDPVNYMNNEKFLKYYTEEIWKTYALTTRTHQELVHWF